MNISAGSAMVENNTLAGYMTACNSQARVAWHDVHLYFYEYICVCVAGGRTCEANNG